MIIIFFSAGSVCAEEKNWSGEADETNWSNDDNWFPDAVPSSQDDVVIDKENADVKCAATFKAQSLTIGARETSTLTSENFVFGTIAPDSSSAVAISNNLNGKIILKGVGTVMVKGKYEDSEGTLAYKEPTFIFWIK